MSGFIHNGRPADIETVMVAGRFVMRDQRVLTLDEDAIISETGSIERSAWQRLVARVPGARFPVRLASG